MTAKDTIDNSYTDGSLSSGAISYSGADIKAVVFLPISREDAKQKFQELNQTFTKLRQRKSTIDPIAKSLSSKLVIAKNDEDNTKIAWEAAVAVGDEELIDSALTLYRVAQTLRKQAETELQEFNQRNPPAKRNNIARQLDALAQQMQGLIDAAENTAGGTEAIVLGDLQTISYSIHREKFPVRTLGRVYPKSYVRGPRTIAGSLIFTVMNRAALWQLLNKSLKFYSTGVGIRGHDSAGVDVGTTVLVDQLPPFDVTLIFSNEVGDNSYMNLYGVEIVNEGQTMSIEDLLTENVMQFVARDLDPLQPIYESRRKLDPTESPPKTLSNFATSLTRSNKTNPFI